MILNLPPTGEEEFKIWEEMLSKSFPELKKTTITSRRAMLLTAYIDDQVAKEVKKVLRMSEIPKGKKGKKRTYTTGWWVDEPVLRVTGFLGNQIEVIGLVVHEERRVLKSMTAAKAFVRQFGVPGSLKLSDELKRGY